jgi:hypothetical protein
MVAHRGGHEIATPALPWQSQAGLPYVVCGCLGDMDKTTLYLPADLQQSVRDLSRRSGRPQAALTGKPWPSTWRSRNVRGRSRSAAARTAG